MKYKLYKNSLGEINAILIIGQNIFIPFDPDNTDYQEFLRWCEQGNTPEPADE